MEHRTIETAAAEPAAVGFAIERDALHGALQLLKRVTERRNTIPVLSTLLFAPAAEGSAVEMTATDLDLQLALTLPCQWEGQGTFCVDAYGVADVIKKAPKGGDVEFSEREGKMTVRSGRTVNRLALDGRHAEEFPRLQAKREDEPQVPGFTVPAPQLVADLAAVAWAQGKEELRYYLKGTALQAQGGRLYMVATDGCSLAFVERDAPEGADKLPDVILPAKGCDIIRRALKGRDDIVAVAASESRFVIAGEGLRLIGKPVDGTFPDWRKVLPGEGEALQLVALPEMEPRMPLPAVEMAAKAIGAAPAVEMMADRVRLTSPERPEFTAICMLLKEAALPKGFDYEMPGRAAALDYLTDLATAAGLPQFSHEVEHSEYAEEDHVWNSYQRRYVPAKHAEPVKRTETIVDSHLVTESGMVLGATFGRSGYVFTEEPDYSTLTMREVERYVGGDVYEDGAYSVAMPRIRQGMAAAVTIGEPGVDERALATKNGAIGLSADQVAALCGDPAEFERVEIPERIYWHGRPLEQGWRLAEPLGTVEKSGKRAKRRELSDREVLQAYTADPAATVAALQPVPTVEATVIAETIAELAKGLSGWSGAEGKVIPFIRPAPAVEMTAATDPEAVEAAPAPAVPNEPEAPAIEVPEQFTYSHWRHGGWYVSEVRYPNGACGCVSNNYADGKWRIACDPRPFEEQPTFRTRHEAAVAEFLMVKALPPEPAPAVPNAPAKAYDDCHTAAGKRARREGLPRELPSYFTDRTGPNARKWLAGWDSAEPVAAETPVECDSAPPALPSQPEQPENAPGEALAKPEAVPEAEPDPVSVQIAALEARIARLEAERNGSGTQPESKSGAEPAAETPAVKMQKPAFGRDRRLRIVRRYLAMRRQRDLDKRALMEGRGWTQDRLAELAEARLAATVAQTGEREARKARDKTAAELTAARNAYEWETMRLRSKRKRLTRRLVEMRQRLRSANSAVAALVEGGVKARDNWQAAEEREAKVKRMLSLARFRTRELIEALRAARATAEAKGKAASKVEDAEFRAADLAKQVEDLQARLAEETARADSADVRFDAERDRLQARIVALENEKIERLSRGRIKMAGYGEMNVAVPAAPWPMQNASNGRLQ